MSRTTDFPNHITVHVMARIIQMCIKSADLSSLGAAPGVYRRWVHRLEDEVSGVKAGEMDRMLILQPGEQY